MTDAVPSGRRRPGAQQGSPPRVGAAPRPRRPLPALLPVLLPLALLTVLSACSVPEEQVPDAASTSPLQTLDADQLGDPEVYAAELVAQTNRARTEEGQEALVESSCAQEQALLRAEALAATDGELVHAPLAPVTAACAPAATSGENLSRAAVAPGDVVDAWMDSPGHRSNILDPAFAEVGVACTRMTVDAQVQMLCSQVFLGA